jgi:hypothetical protein
MTDSQQPNPFSREGSSPTEGLGSDPGPGQATPSYQPIGDESNDQYASHWPSYPAADPYGNPATDPYGRPRDSYGSPSGSSSYSVPGLGFDSQQIPPYGDPGQSYEQSPSYAQPYEVNPYQPSFGEVSPYAVVPPTPTQHPQANLALIYGILGTVLGMFCVVGGLVGIGGIVVGRRVKNEIDAEPGRYTGRSQAVAGLVTGIIGVSIFTLVTVLIVLAVIAGIASSSF